MLTYLVNRYPFVTILCEELDDEILKLAGEGIVLVYLGKVCLILASLDQLVPVVLVSGLSEGEEPSDNDEYDDA